MAEGEEQEDKEEEDKEKREKRKERAAKRRAPTEKKTTPDDATNFSFLAFEHVWSSRAKEEYDTNSRDAFFVFSSSFSKTNENRKTKTKTKKQRGGAKKTKKGARVQHHDDGVEELFNDYHETREEEHASRSVVRVGRVDVRVRWCNEGQRSRRESFKDGTAETLGATFEKFDIVGGPGVRGQLEF